MYTGPKLQPDIQIVLLRARLWKYLFVTDIKQMYRQILVHPDDRDYQRILWRFSPTFKIDEYRLCTVTYGTSAAPYQALRTIRELAMVNAQSTRAAAILLNDTFVDDVLTGANSVQEALECQQELIQLCSRAKFELRKWASNCSEILHAVPEDTHAMSPLMLFDASEDPALKLLGLNWDPSSDTFSFKIHSMTKNPTKRSILSDIARIFDPLGILSPITLFSKHLMQRLWTDGVGWDDPVSIEIAQLWSRYHSELHLIADLSVRRRLTYDQACSVQLHAFSDSSEKGYAAAVYLRVETPTSVYCHLVAGKSKVAPLKRCTIPRLELCGAVLAARLLNFVVNTYAGRLKIDEQHAWTDSTTALVWIQSSPHRWATFIANRTSQIQELTSPSIWRYVPTQLNPVDCASRGLFPSELVNHPLWWSGPPYLQEADHQWPSSLMTLPSDIDTSPTFELRKSNVLHVIIKSSISDLLARYSKLDKILRILAYVLRLRKLRSSGLNSFTVNAGELMHALSALIYFTQHTVYHNEIQRLTKGLHIISKDLRRLDLFIDPSGLVRVGGRLTNANLPYAHKHPVLLPSSHPLTNLLIDHHHVRLCHPGAHTLQTHLQQDYWIQSARRVIRSRLRLCIPCFKTQSKSVELKMATLPKHRVQPELTTQCYLQAFHHLVIECEKNYLQFNPIRLYADFEKAIHNAARHVWPSIEIKGCRFHLGQSWYRKIQQLGLTTRVQQIKPFAITGVDYAGPIVIKQSRGRTSASRSTYICLFVCLATKALHLELSSDLTTETFLLAFTRFIARRGPVHEMHSDCGTNFVSAARLLTPLNTFINSASFQDKVHQQLANNGIHWHFNPPSSPHFGGLWEAGVKSTKSLILRSIGIHRLTSEELMTLLTLVEATLNSRPLSALSNDPSDLSALTPSHFLTLEPSTNLPEPNLETIPLSKLQRWRLINDLHRYFWTRWRNEYLSSLQIRSKWLENHGELKIGDLVLIREATPPLHWRLGRILTLHPGSDGISRVPTVQTTSGILTRPAVKLCPLPTP
ncbi:uncharacterized protein LOC112594280 [Melanaphis sacchari]|uniref:uncharacterized protein LOC112594280 n=1 Tax=Melanaphis sacchari TaxID=742174 RepID=UPI000DC1568B|nr:uncharacterized protein LOC112594280 [Melanaphis sacchari]